MNSSRLSVEVFGLAFPHYRYGVFDLVSQDEQVSYTFRSPEKVYDPLLCTPGERPFQYKAMVYRRLRLPGTNNYVTFSSSPIRSILSRRVDAVVLANDILRIDCWLCIGLSKLVGRKVILWGHGVSRPETHFRDNIRKFMQARADACLYYGEDARQKWIQLGLPPEKLFVAHNALDTDQQAKIIGQLTRTDIDNFRHLSGLDGKRVILFSGRLVPQKKPAVLLRALVHVLRTLPDAHVVIIGEGPEKSNLESITAELHLQDHVTFTGALYDEDEVARFMMISEVAVMPAYAGLTIQHAFGYGLPIILGCVPHSHGPEARLVVDGETGLFFPDGDDIALAERVCRLLADTVLWRRLAENALEVVYTKHNKQMMALGIMNAVRYSLGLRAVSIDQLSTPNLATLKRMLSEKRIANGNLCSNSNL